MEHTTIVVLSAFDRPPVLNTRGGRDHSLSSCALRLGAGVKANTVIGASHDIGPSTLPIDPQTGLTVLRGGTTVTPANVLASVMSATGYDSSALRTNVLP